MLSGFPPLPRCTYLRDYPESGILSAFGGWLSAPTITSFDLLLPSLSPSTSSSSSRAELFPFGSAFSPPASANPHKLDHQRLGTYVSHQHCGILSASKLYTFRSTPSNPPVTTFVRPISFPTLKLARFFTKRLHNCIYSAQDPRPTCPPSCCPR